MHNVRRPSGLQDDMDSKIKIIFDHKDSNENYTVFYGN